MNGVKAVSVQIMRESDAKTIASGVPSRELMRRAGEGIFRAASWKPPVAVVCGKGNNAGDGYVVAGLLSEQGIDCTLILLSDSFSEDGQYYFDLCREKGVPVLRYEEGMSLSSYGTVLDCILGTGFQGEVSGVTKAAITSINESGAFVISADIPSGLNGDTGRGITFVHSDLTVSIGTYKTGHFRGEYKKAMKEKTNIDIGIEIAGPSCDVFTLSDGAVYERYERDTSVSEYAKEHINVEKFLEYCKVCSNYGKNWSCSPFDFDPMIIWNAYRNFRIVTYRFCPAEGMSIDDAAELIFRMKDVFMKDVYEMEAKAPGSLAIFAGTCNLCSECAKVKSLPCRSPERMRHSIESIGGDVGRTIKDFFDIDIQWGTKDSLPAYYVLCGGLLMK